MDCHTIPQGTDHQRLAQLPSRRLLVVLALTFAYCVAEVIGGWLTGSLALLADAGHMITDTAALGLALFASWLAAHPAPSQKTFGYYRFEILAAFINGIVLVVLSGWIVFEAIHRFSQPPEVQGPGMMAVTLGGLVVNLVALWLLHGQGGSNLNVKGAYLHILGDLLGTLGALLAGVLILFFGWHIADPIASILISMLVLYSTGKLLLESANILLEASPSHIDVAAVRDELQSHDQVEAVHDLHIWTITSGKEALSAHIVVAPEACNRNVLTELHRTLNERFGIHHVTIQLETEDFCEDRLHALDDCVSAPFDPTIPCPNKQHPQCQNWAEGNGHGHSGCCHHH